MAMVNKILDKLVQQPHQTLKAPVEEAMAIPLGEVFLTDWILSSHMIGMVSEVFLYEPLYFVLHQIGRN